MLCPDESGYFQIQYTLFILNLSNISIPITCLSSVFMAHHHNMDINTRIWLDWNFLNESKLMSVIKEYSELHEKNIKLQKNQKFMKKTYCDCWLSHYVLFN
jgi:hypothetical protein